MNPLASRHELIVVSWGQEEKRHSWGTFLTRNNLGHFVVTSVSCITRRGCLKPLLQPAAELAGSGTGRYTASHRTLNGYDGQTAWKEENHAAPQQLL